MPHADDIARLRATADQAQMEVRELASITASYYTGLRGAGLKRREAMPLAQIFVSQLVASVRDAGGVE